LHEIPSSRKYFRTQKREKTNTLAPPMQQKRLVQAHTTLAMMKKQVLCCPANHRAAYFSRALDYS
jgi:hypothetical protein